MANWKRFLQQETVLCAAWGLALVSAILVPPSLDYWDYIDWHTLGLLFSLMSVMAGLQKLGLFRYLGEAMLERTATSRQLEGVLIFLPFFSSMIVTNDVALITFVPFALEVLVLAKQQRRIIPVVAMQTIAANLGSMTTPIGNPQNLYLYSHYGLGLGDFFSTLLPLTAASALLLALFLLFGRSALLPSVWRGRDLTPPSDRSRLTLYILLFVLCLGAVAKLVPVWALSFIVLIALLGADRSVLRRIDWSLLLTFVGFFVFVGNLGRLPSFHDLFQSLLDHHEVACAVLASQVISNVPAALLLSGFTSNAQALLVGTNLGGLGTLIASMASLISYKQVARNYPLLRSRYLLWFTAANVIFLLVLLALYWVLTLLV